MCILELLRGTYCIHDMIVFDLMLQIVVSILDFYLLRNAQIFLTKIFMSLRIYLYFTRVKIIMEKDALKNPLTSRNAASARLLQGQVHSCTLSWCSCDHLRDECFGLQYTLY